ncbi:right-handed parallel beta-helix repeat-containing protein [Neptunicella sp.]|uniref:right-handed parallel beta-helix repeat-containing protein n=1 Tax=Neptunicella sp. TaxID=2125986 RepID=UPI003F690740
MASRLHKFIGLFLVFGILPVWIGQSSVSATTINVTDYGATGNDNTDDVVSIQQAINETSASDTLFIPDGIYKISRPILLKTNIKITGQSQNNTVIQFAGDNIYSMMTLSGVSRVEIASLTLDGNNRDVANAIFAEKGSGHKLHHLTIKNLNHNGFGPHGVLFSGSASWTDSVTHSVIVDNTFRNIGVNSPWGAAVRLANGASHNQVLSNTITDTGRGGILANQGSTDLIIRENRISGIGKAAEGLSIEVHTECNRATIEDNIVDHWISLDKTNYSAIRRNKITTDKSSDWKYAALELAGGTNNIFTDNLVDGGTKTGISISINYPKEYIFWGRNTIKHAADWGAQLQGESQGLSYHYFYHNTFSYTYRNHPQSSYPDQGHGFRVNGNTHHITLEQNTFNNNQGLGIEFNGTNIDQFTFINNSIVGNKLAAITTYPGKDLQWSNNKVNGNGDDNVPASSGFVRSALPVVNFTNDATVRMNTPIQFINSSVSKDSAGNSAHVLWDFDDGLPSNQNNPTFTYTQPGSYRVTLIVWDDKGRAARKEKVITVLSER